MRMRHFCLFVVLVLAVLVSGAAAQTVVQRSILGSHVEGMTFIDKGSLANNIVVVDAFEVNALPTQKNGSWQHLFTLGPNDFSLCPRGIAYDSKAKLLIFNEPRQVSQFSYYDLTGRKVSTRTVTYPATYTPNNIEGIVYMPKSSPYPGHIAVLANIASYPNQNRIEIIGPANTVVKEIIPNVPASEEKYLTGLAYQEDTGLFVVAEVDSNTFWTIDSTGAVVGTYSAPDNNMEGLAFTKTGDMVAMPLGGHDAYFFDSAMNRLPAKDRAYHRGLDADPPVAMTWNSDAMQYLFVGSVHKEVSAVDAGVTTRNVLFDLATLGWEYTSGLTYVPGESNVAVGDSGGHQIDVATLQGAAAYSISTGGYMPGSWVTYVPTKDVFATRRATQLHQWGRGSGDPILTVELSTVGLTTVTGMTFAQTATGDQFVITGYDANHAAWIVVTDENFVPITRYGTTSPLSSITYISNGPNAGKFASLDSDRNELVIWQIP